jgi:hypothetical protein
MLKLMGRRLKTVVLETPTPSGTVHSSPPEASQLAVITGEEETAQPLGHHRPD